MWAAFCDELANGRQKMKQPFYCVTPEETHQSHLIFTQALESYGNRSSLVDYAAAVVNLGKR